MKPFIKKDKASSSTSEEASSQRPKRSTCQKNLDGSNGLLWREETDLKRALYASLQETRKRNLEDEEEEELKAPPIEAAVNGQDEILKKAKVHAQRKFAQGSTPNSPVPTPLKVQSVNNSATELLPYRRPKTEDFLTFLCLRGTSILPPSLDFLNCCAKSDTSSECRSLSPDLEIKDSTNQKEATSKGYESREKNSARHESLSNGVSRKPTACKALSKRHTDMSHAVKKTCSKSQKEVSIVRKRKSRDEREDVEFIPTNSSSRLKVSANSRTRSSTFHALREKYKNQRLAAGIKKLPAKNTTTSQASSTKSLTTRSRSVPKQSDKTVSRNDVTKNRNKSVSPVLNKKVSHGENKLAIEKRKSLRSAHPTRGFGHKKVIGTNKKTMWLRRAKLVPPIVDVESDSEPEIISTASSKKTSPHVVPKKQENAARLSERLRSRDDSPKGRSSTLTSRQVLLRKHMQNRLKAKTSVLHTKNVKSTTIKKPTKQSILKRVVRKNLVSKTMSLRKDLQNKRVTRSAKHQIEEMLWANPEKRSKVQGTKNIPLSRIDKKRISSDDPSLPKKPKLMPRKLGENKQVKTTSDKEIKGKVSMSVDPNKMDKLTGSSKLVKKVIDAAVSTRSSKTPPRSDPKPGCSYASDKVTALSKSENVNIIENKATKPVEAKISKPVEAKISKPVEAKISKPVEGKISKPVEGKISKPVEGKISKPVEVKISKPVEGKIIKTVENKISKSVESRISKPVESKITKPVESKITKPVESKVSKPIENRVSKHVESKVSKPVESKINKHAESKISKHAESKVSKHVESKLSKPVENKVGKIMENKINKPVETKVNKSAAENIKKEPQVTDANIVQKSSNSVDNRCKETNNISQNRMSDGTKCRNLTPDVDLGSNLNLLNVKDMKTLMKENNLESNLENMDSSLVIKETSVQNNLNLQKIDKNPNKDISKLISLNVECEEPAFVINCEPSCSGIGQVEVTKKLNLDKSAKLCSSFEVSPEEGFIKKHSDKRFIKNVAYKDDKQYKKNSDKSQKIQNKSGEKSTKSHKKEGSKESENNKVKSEITRHVSESTKTTEKQLGKTVKKDSLHKDKIEIHKHHPDKSESGKRSIKSEQKKESKKLKTESLKDPYETIAGSFSNFKRNCENLCLNTDSSKDKIDIDRKKSAVIPSSSGNSSHMLDKDTDDDSDYDITLDEYLKLKCSWPMHGHESSKATCLSQPKELNHKTSLPYDENKDSKTAKKETEKESLKLKKEGESSKHKKDKSIFKDKSHEKSPRKEDKISRKDAEKSLAKLLKRERSKSSKKEEKDRLKHKRDGSSSSKSSKRDFEKDGSKLSRKEGGKEVCSSEKKIDSKNEFSETKKEKSSKKESSKLSRSNSYDDTKSPKKKKKINNEFKQIEEIKNLISKSSILNEVSGFKEFKRRLSSDKKAKKRKKLALLKEKKLSKKLSSKLLRKYSKKKGLKKKNKLKKKELKKGIKLSNVNNKVHSKNKNKKHKTKSEHHRRDSQEKVKNVDVTLSASTNTATLWASTNLPHAFQKSKIDSQTQKNLNLNPEPMSTNAQTSTSDIAAPSTVVIESVSKVSSPIVTLATDTPQRTNDNYQGVVNSVETYPTETILLATRDCISQVPLHFSQDMPPPPKTMADAATNTCEEDLDSTLSSIPEHLGNEEMSVGTQTVTPVGSPSPTAEMRSIVPLMPIESPLTDSHKSYYVKPINLGNSSNIITSVRHDIPGCTINPKLSQMPCNPNLVSPVTPLKPKVTTATLVNNHVPLIIPERPKMPIYVNSPVISVPLGTPKISVSKAIFPITPGKPKVISHNNSPIKSVTPGKPINSSCGNNPIVPVTPGKPKMTSCVSNPISPVTPDTTIVTNCVGNPMSPETQTPKVNSSVCNPVSSIITGTTEVTSYVGNLMPPVALGKPKVISCVSNTIPSVIPGKPKVTSCIDNTIPSVTPGKSKNTTSSVSNTSHSVTPAKSKVPASTNIPVRPSSPKVKKRTVKKPKSPPSVPSSSKPEPFPLNTARLVSAPVYYPRADEFNDPLEYISKIRPEAEQYGICKIVPPSSFKPECKVNDDMRFTAHNQYLHKMLYRWGPNVQHTACIRKHLKTQKVKLEQAPLIGGIELDVSKFYHTVKQFGGLQNVIEKNRWQRVADAMRVPKTAQDRVTKLYDAYCKYLVSYDTLPKEEKQKIEEEVIADHEKRIKLRNSPSEPEKEEDELDDDENNDCVTKGRSTPLSNFFRIARNTMTMWFKTEPSPEEVEHEFWKVVTERQQHVVVHAGNIDSSVTQSGFPTNRSPFAKHPWNLKVLTNNSRSILRSIGPLSGITIPTLHVGMLFTTGCWYRDPHSFPWIEYLHTGASKIWYGIPANGCEKFRNAMKKIMPEYCTNKPLWLSSDTAMVPPELLVKHGASLSRTIQNSGQFIVIFPESFTSTICCGYCVSESVYFAPTSWLDLAVKAFQDIRNSCESPAFSLERLLFSIGNDPKPQLKLHLKTLQKILPMIENIRNQELHMRSQLNELGLKQFERLPLLEVRDKKKKSRGIEEETEQECEVCRTPCYVSMVIYPQEDGIYCLPHALEHIQKKNFKLCKLKYTYNEYDLNELLKKITDLVSQLPNPSAKKKSPKKKLVPVTEK